MNHKLQEDQPIFLQIADVIEKSIVDGNIKAHEQIPSTNVFSKQYQINPATAAKGINLLVDQQILYKKRGVGMFVTEKAFHVILEKRKNRFYDSLMVPLLIEAKRLNLSKDQLKQWIEEGLDDSY
ncbi:DNA-binding transcriptional regulator YhcF, GntR family [Pelagirhabdus alkalitolerans]|uniref:DNA-binding transcriptional regulator YhcF, GntR family n=1 Tax=Pelagirhabdus alkalitolerans TaxID=1612202 RepID=A0A1G6HK55_9BACI|nr:GntR family transcriptional regulator [Pelagirhabdus alkalitolerans]SDB93806.1 DNA-binding transcriptional regulator YhcF, GntR family [Pelagirhabdus alkalitolerans]